MKKTYITPAFLAVELSNKRNFMLSGSSESGETVLPGGGEGDGTDIGAKEYTSKSLWDNEW